MKGNSKNVGLKNSRYRLLGISEYVQYIVENYPYHYYETDNPTPNLEKPEGINAVGIVAIITTSNVTIRAFYTGIMMFGFFLAWFHGIRWEEIF